MIGIDVFAEGLRAEHNTAICELPSSVRLQFQVVRNIDAPEPQLGILSGFAYREGHDMSKCRYLAVAQEAELQ